jgi:16S rRNA (guanine527-N7)-methyltransferase
MSLEVIFKEFPELSEKQRSQFEMLKSLYEYWNAQINVISRKDTENFYERHVLHSLAIVKVVSFRAGSKIIDIGTGGGFPGIPLAIMFPDVHFTLVDSIGKKIKVVNEVAQALGLHNVTGIHCRAEDIQDKFDFVVSRAVTAMPDFLKWTRGKFLIKSTHSIPNGILYLKGGDLEEELKGIRRIKIYPIPHFFKEEFFETKAVVYVPAN